MMAYIDENGNISSTPPDPTKKRKVINAEDIEIGVPKQRPVDPSELIRKGDWLIGYARFLRQCRRREQFANMAIWLDHAHSEELPVKHYACWGST